MLNSSGKSAIPRNKPPAPVPTPSIAAAFSSSAHRQKMMKIIDDWETSREEMDWYSFQQEYRDYIDLVKLFQLMPVVGAAVGGVANHQLTGQLGEVARHVFHLRILKEMK